MLKSLRPHFVRVILTVCLSSFFSLGYARTYYISSGEGNDDWAGTSSATAWQTLSRLGRVSLQAGDTVLLRRGDEWGESLVLSRLRGSQSEPIVVAAYGSGAKPRLQPRSADQVIHLQHSHYVQVENLHILAPSGKKGIRIAGDSRYVQVRHCRVEGHPDGSSRHGIVYAATSSGQKPTYPVVEHNEVSFFYEAVIGGGGLNQGGRVAHNYVHSATPTNSSDLIRAIGGDFEGLSIAHNHLTGWYDDAIDLYTGSNVVVEYNRVHSPAKRILGSGNGIKLGGITNQVAKAPTSYGNVARYNVVYDLQQRKEGHLCNGIDTNGGYDCEIYGNLIYAVQGDGIVANGDGCVVYNNTVVSDHVALYLHPSGAQAQAYNNILSGRLQDVNINHGSSSIRGSHNLLVHDRQRGNYRSENDLQGDPGFVNPQAAQFTLKPSSSAINAGVARSGYRKCRQGYDILGRVDLGCHEFTDGQGAPPEPSPSPSPSPSPAPSPSPSPNPSPVPSPAPIAAQGLNYSYYEGYWQELPDFDKLKAKKRGTVDNFSLKPREQDERFAFLYEGYLTITQAGNYTFYTASDDGSKLYLDGKEVVDNDGIHAVEEKSGQVYLSQGQHPIKVAFFERTVGEVLEVRYAGPGVSKQRIPNNVLSTVRNDIPTPAPAPQPAPTADENGLNYTYYEGEWDELPDFSVLKAKKTGTVTNFSLKPRENDHHFAFVFEGQIHIKETGMYTFYTTSDDGSKLYLDNQAVVDNDGLHPAEEESGQMYLSQGHYPIRVTFFERRGKEVLEVRYAGPGISKQRIPNSVLSGKEPLSEESLSSEPLQEGSGLNYSYYEGYWQELPDFDKLKAKKRGTVDNFSLKPREQDERFAFLYEGYLTITQAGNYTFYTASDDGSKLYLDGKEVVDNDGIHAVEEKSGQVYLSQGQHPIKVAFFERTVGEVLEVRYAGPGVSKQRIPNNVLSRSKDSEGLDTQIATKENSVLTNEYEAKGTSYSINTYPNPVRDQLNVSVNSIPGEAVSLHLANSVGRIVWSRKISAFNLEKDITISISQYIPKSGVFYLIVEQSSGKRNTIQLIKR